MNVVQRKNMANISYIKSVRSRFQNTLESELTSAKSILNGDMDGNNLDNIYSEITKYLEMLGASSFAHVHLK